ncbi:uncharacterized protein LOC132054190 [Lycium ferocissimum]|uniref:uncharacterized protein LOC132054190 n=1 Tax=Lycium ferocissimum TaxID=112874 RepID=UPI002814B7D4|nr:uncharacterized protein LOC132054190 [Lycium ferocissimum]
MSSMKFEIDRFCGRNNFNIWKIQMMALLRREGSVHAIDGKFPDGTSASNKEKIEGDELSMENEHHRWMYDRVLPNRRGLRDEFKQGIEGFINRANLFCQKDGTIRCPCAYCNCIKWLKPEDVGADLCSKGFMDDYYVWTSHGEIEGSASNICNHNFVVGESSQDPRLHEMVMDALGMYNEGNNQQLVDQPPNEEAQRFYAQSESASHPFCEGMSHSALSIAIRLLSIKLDVNISIAGMNAMIGLMKELNPNLDIPDDYYKAKKLVSKLGLSSIKIDCCEKGCMLYYRDDADLENYKVCGISRFKNLPMRVDDSGKLACPCCKENTKSFTLKHGGKNSWFGCHRQFLPVDHEFRSMRNAFRKNKTEHDLPPPTLSGEKIWERFRDLPKVTETPPSRLNGYGVEHNWTKHSIFWELPYWKHNLLRHNLDVMHIEKNYFNNLFNTVMDVRDKTKDNIKARKDLMKYFR